MLHWCYMSFGAMLLAFALGAPAEDLVVNLPGVSFPMNYNQYSGYLNGTSGRFLHYWFIESQNDPLTDPLVLWLNGGPGCSSLLGLLTELGPFYVLEDGSGLYENPYTWNLIANIVYLESPACVGFSYDENNNCATGDDEVAQMNYLALQHFFAKFPEYRDRDFYIFGESYGGIYVPTLSKLVLDNNGTFPLNFVGFGIGNGLLTYDVNDNSLMFFGNYHGLLGEKLWAKLVDNCCLNGDESQESCFFATSTNTTCRTAFLQATNIIYFSGLNIYNLYGDCIEGTKGVAHRDIFDRRNMLRKYKIETGQINRDDPPCTNNDGERTYLNSNATRTALNIPSTVGAWDICSNEVSSLYSREYDTVVDIVIALTQQIPGIIYSGDTDMSVNFLGNEWDIENMGLTVVEDRRKWEEGGQVAGFVKRWVNLDFLTVRGSGHMVPEFKPGPALKLFTDFLNGNPY